METCMFCENWKYSDFIEKKYGEGTGICKELCHPVGCDRASCILFCPRQDNNVRR